MLHNAVCLRLFSGLSRMRASQSADSAPSQRLSCAPLLQPGGRPGKDSGARKKLSLLGLLTLRPRFIDSFTRKAQAAVDNGRPAGSAWQAKQIEPCSFVAFGGNKSSDRRAWCIWHYVILLAASLKRSLRHSSNMLEIPCSCWPGQIATFPRTLQGRCVDLQLVSAKLER